MDTQTNKIELRIQNNPHNYGQFIYDEGVKTTQ